MAMASYMQENFDVLASFLGQAVAIGDEASIHIHPFGIYDEMFTTSLVAAVHKL